MKVNCKYVFLANPTAMDQVYRNKLDLHCDDLVPKIDLEQLLPKLIDNGVYNEDDIKMEKWKVTKHFHTIFDPFNIDDFAKNVLFFLLRSLTLFL